MASPGGRVSAPLAAARMTAMDARPAEQHRAASVFGGELVLTVTDDAATLISNGVFLMSTATARSEFLLGALAALAAPAADVLLAGLGLGVSADAAARSGAARSITVVEVEPAIAEWWSSKAIPAARLDAAATPIDVVVADFASWISATTQTFDYIAVDIDNGPGWLVDETNAGLYDADGLASIKRALRPGGVAAFWSATVDDAAFVSRLAAIFTSVQTLAVPTARGGPHGIYCCR